MDKIKMTEKQAEKIYDDCILEMAITRKQCFLAGMRDCGYIKKQEIQK